jgi:hypothetical protein
MQILHETGTPFTAEQLEWAFDLVASKKDWRNPISAYVARDLCHQVVCAIQFFTAAPIEVFETDQPGQVLVTSCGYRLGPAGG